MICPDCGTQNDNGSMFCAHCGKPLAGSTGSFGKGGDANGTLGFAEGARKVLNNMGVNVLRFPERFRACMADECDHRAREYVVFERNCTPELLGAYASAASNPNNTDELKRAAWIAEQYLTEQRVEDASIAHNIAACLANAVASSCGMQFDGIATAGMASAGMASADMASPGMAPSGAVPTGTVHIGVQPPAANGSPMPNTVVSPTPVATPNTYMAQPNPPSNKKSPVPIIVGCIALVAVFGGIIAFVLLNNNTPTDSSSAEGSTTSSSFVGGISTGRSSATRSNVVLTFDGDSGYGSMEPITAEEGASIVLPKCDYQRDGYEFVAWVDNKGNEYDPGDSLTIDKDTTLTAKWTPVRAEGTTDTGNRSDNSTDTSSSSSSTPSSTNTSSDSQASPQASPAASFPRMWSGTYIGTSSYVEGDHHITRAVAFNFTSVTDSGQLEGICYVGTDETGAGETYGTCYVAGNVDWNTGEIHFQGTGWIDQGGLGDLREYSGSVNFSTQTMGGSAWDVGTGLYETPWDVYAVSQINIWQDGSLTTVG